MHDLLIVTHCDLGVRPEYIVSSLGLTGLGRNEYLLHTVHEGAKDQGREHDQHERRGHNQFIVVLRVAVRALFAILTIELDLEN